MAVTYVEADAGSGGAKLATDQIAGTDYPICKIDNGVAGTAGGPVATGNPLPVILEAGTAEVGKLAAGVAEIGNVKNSGTFATQATLQAGTAEIGKLAAGTAEIGKLGAGTAGIGKLTANSGVDIGDVDVTSLAGISNGSLNGPAEPTIDSITQAAIVSKTGADQSLIAAPGASKQIWVYGINFTMSTAGTVAFQDEDDTAITGAMGIADTGGMSVSPAGNFAMPLWKVATNKALEADIVTGTINGSITYGIVSV